MSGKMIDFATESATAPGYLAAPDGARSDTPGVVVLHAWWGLTEPFRQACDRLAEAGFVALAPDLYRGKSTASIEEADTLSSALFGEFDRVRADIIGAMRYLRQYGQTTSSDAVAVSGKKLALIGFSMGAAYALDMSVYRPDDVTAVVTFYGSYTGLDFGKAQAAYLCHFAEDDPYEGAESIAATQQALQASGRRATIYTYPGTKHWFVEANRPDAYDAAAAALAWERTIAFLNAELRGQNLSPYPLP